MGGIGYGSLLWLRVVFGFTNVLEQAHALLAQGRCLTHTGDPTADQPLRHARGLFDQMCARPRIQECDNLIAQAARSSS